MSRREQFESRASAETPFSAGNHSLSLRNGKTEKLGRESGVRIGFARASVLGRFMRVLCEVEPELRKEMTSEGLLILESIPPARNERSATSTVSIWTG